jgi:serine phosphatase RsbU (regulator of sigma subunit)
MVSEQFFGTSALTFQMVREDTTFASDADAFNAQILAGPVFATEVQNRFEAQTPYLSRSLMRHLREHARPVLASNISTMPDAIEMSISPGVDMLAAVACPILAESADAHLNVLYVTLPPHCGTTDWLAVVAFAVEQYRLAESAWVSRRFAQEQATTERELQRAREIQLRLVPRRLAVPGFDIAIGYEPCRWVGGDYVDVAPTSNGLVLLAVADVCGKGMPAALIATSLRTMVRTGLQAGMDLPDLLSATRGQLDDCLATDTFITMAAVLADPDGGALRCVNAGHPAPLILSPDGSVRELPSADNFPLGIMVEPIECRDESLARGELLLMFTDGISELSDATGTMLGTRRFGEIAAQIYAAGSSLPASELATQIAEALSRHRGPRSADDDQTFLLAKRL